MARIIGLKEKQLALAEINQKLKSLIPINEFLNEINDSGLYTISFTKTKAQPENDTTDVENNKAVADPGDKAEHLVKRGKRNKEERIEAPFLCSDADTVKSFVVAYKKELVNELRAKAKEFSIEFNDEDEALLK